MILRTELVYKCPSILGSWDPRTVWITGLAYRKTEEEARKASV